MNAVSSRVPWRSMVLVAAGCWPFVVSPLVWSKDQGNALGVQCRIDETSFDGDADVTRADYVIPPGGKPPRFRILAGHVDAATGYVSVELKAKGVISGGSVPLSQEPLWKSVLKLPKQRDSAITSGDFLFTHFDPHGDAYAAGTVQFKTADAHRGECRFRLPMDVADLSHSPAL